MRRKKTYGSKKTEVSSATSKIFGGALAIATRPHVTPSCQRSPLAEITSEILNLSLKDTAAVSVDLKVNKNEIAIAKASRHFNVAAQAKDIALPIVIEPDDVSEISKDVVVPEDSPESDPLEPLIQAYLKDRQIHLTAQPWDSIFPPDAIVTKVAEATYAEVYRITTDEGTSIIKVELLQVPSDPESMGHRQAHLVENVVPEIRIMNTLTEVPGFVLFKDAHVVRGKPPKLIVDAFEAHKADGNNEVEFPHPGTYRPTSTFLVLELGDAGYSMDRLVIKDINQVWDIFLGVTMALARAETLYEFEHRDLHESNICISHKPPSTSPSPPAPQSLSTPTQQTKYGHSDITITIIDYGLSRMALPSNEVVFLDLEQDLSIFHGTDGHPQFDIYRRMRTHLFTSTHTHQKSAWHNAFSRSEHGGSHSWSEHIPYTNVLWIRYILGWLMKQLSVEGKRELMGEMTELNRRLDPRTKRVAFGSAAEVLGWVVERGWLGEGELVGGE